MGSDDDYEVGYRRPPKHSQFKKGQSGNRKGRPRGSRNANVTAAEKFAEALAMKVPVTLPNGRKAIVTMRDRIIYGWVIQAAKDPKAAKELFGILPRFEAEERVSEAESSDQGRRLATGVAYRMARHIKTRDPARGPLTKEELQREVFHDLINDLDEPKES